MTTFGIDVSHHQTGLSLVEAAREGRIEFAYAKMTEGQGWKDTQFETYRRQAEEAGLLFAGYHWVRSDSSAAAQAQNVKEVIGDRDIPVVIDAERTSGSGSPRIADIDAFRRAARDRGLKVTLLYLPHWYWNEISRPDVATYDVLQSSYGPNDGKYPGDDSDRWNHDGTFVPRMLQYTSNGRVAGYGGPVDLNAFRGTRNELVATGWFKNYGKEQDELDMASLKDVQEAVATAPIVVDAESGETLPLQRVLRTLLNRVGTLEKGAAKQIADAVAKALPASAGDVNVDDIEKAVANVLREGTDATS